METNNIKVLIFGASGILGSELCSFLKKNNINYDGTYYLNYVENLIHVDFSSIDNIIDSIKKTNATVCINCIAERNVDMCEKKWEITKNTNIDISNKIANACNLLNVHLIHISTDYVFDGKNPPYFPHSLTNPLNNYGISKKISEFRVMSNCPNATIIRVPVLYTHKFTNLKSNAITLIGKKVLNLIEKTKEDNYCIRRPVYIPDFCVFIKDMIIDPKYGIYHFYNPNNCFTKYQIAKLISIFLNKSTNNIEPMNEKIEDTERPFDTQLIDDKFNINNYSFTPFKESIEKCFSSFYHPPFIFNEQPSNNCFFLLDFDGTLIDSERLHYDSYKNALKNTLNYNLDLNNYENIINNLGIDHFLKYDLSLNNHVIKDIKKLKRDFFFKNEDSVNLMKNATKIIEYINRHDINHVVVTNSNKDTVNFLKQKNATLNLLKNWITREDYDKPKPNSECYELAISKYGKGELYNIGFENTFIGYKALKKITNCIYIMTNKNNACYHDLKQLDSYLIDDYEEIFV